MCLRSAPDGSGGKRGGLGRCPGGRLGAERVPVRRGRGKGRRPPACEVPVRAALGPPGLRV